MRLKSLLSPVASFFTRDLESELAQVKRDRDAAIAETSAMLTTLQRERDGALAAAASRLMIIDAREREASRLNALIEAQKNQIASILRQGAEREARLAADCDLRDSEIRRLKSELADVSASYHAIVTSESDLKARLAAQATRIREIEFDLEESTKELDRYRALGYSPTALKPAAEQLAMDGVAGEPQKTKRFDFNAVEQEGYWEVRRLSFIEKNKWFFSEGAEGREFTAEITDKEFVGRVDRRDFSFAKGDVVHGFRRVESWRDEDGKHHAKFTITKVVEVLFPEDNQLPLTEQQTEPVAL